MKSLLPLHCDIIVGDLGAEDNTIQICRNYGAKIIEIPACSNLANARNKLITSNSWQFYIEPWEVLATGHQNIIANDVPGVYNVQIFQGNLITKEARLWHKNTQARFVQPVYEVLNITLPERHLEGVIIYSNKQKEDWSSKLDIIEEWILMSPMAKEPCYYKAFILLGQKKYKEFIDVAKEYLFRDSEGSPAVMMQYYLSLVQFYMGDMKSAVRGAVSCIAVKPLMSEFWCLLGDIHYKTKQYHKAMCYYENAIVLGKRRLQADTYPIDISKYKEYPTTMFNSCKTMVSSGKILEKI